MKTIQRIFLVNLSERVHVMEVEYPVSPLLWTNLVHGLERAIICILLRVIFFVSSATNGIYLIKLLLTALKYTTG